MPVQRKLAGLLWRSAAATWRYLPPGDFQATSLNANDDLCTELQHKPELFLFQENVGVNLDTSGRTNKFICCAKNCKQTGSALKRNLKCHQISKT